MGVSNKSLELLKTFKAVAEKLARKEKTWKSSSNLNKTILVLESPASAVFRLNYLDRQ